MTGPDWRVEREEYPHGGLFELELTTTWRVFHRSAEEPVYVFTDTAEYDHGGGGWVLRRDAKLVDVTVDPDRPVVWLHDREAPPRALPLFPPDVPARLDADAATALAVCLADLDAACAAHQYVDEWSNDVPIPAAMVAVAAATVAASWAALRRQIHESGLAVHKAAVATSGHEVVERFFATALQRSPHWQAYWAARRSLP